MTLGDAIFIAGMIATVAVYAVIMVPVVIHTMRADREMRKRQDENPDAWRWI